MKIAEAIKCKGGVIKCRYEANRKGEVMYECFHCGQRKVLWSGDFDFSDYGYEGEGIIHECMCTHCGARITYVVPNEKEITDESND